MTKYKLNANILRIIKNHDVYMKNNQYISKCTLLFLVYLYQTQTLNLYIEERKKSIGNNKDYFLNTFFVPLNRAFTWSITQQGHDFWEKLHEKVTFNIVHFYPYETIYNN